MRAITTLVFLCAVVVGGGACSWGDGSGNQGDDETPTTDATPPMCGDGICASSEIGNCASDCGSQTQSCPNGTCDNGETTASCPADCPVTNMCGNGTCDASESNATCPADCPPTAACPASPEDCATCALLNLGCPTGHDMNSCFACVLGGGGFGMCTGGLPNFVCDGVETSATCPIDCP